MDDLQKLHLHDSILKKIFYSYDDKNATIILDTKEVIQEESKMRYCIIKLTGITEFNITNYEPWGVGHYVVDINWDELENRIINQYIAEGLLNSNIFIVEIELNSGDRITAYLEGLDINYKNDENI